MHIAVLYSCLLYLMEKFVFEPYGVCESDIMKFSDNIYNNAVSVNDYEILYYSIYYTIRFNFTLDKFERNNVGAQEYIIKSRYCLLSTIIWIYFMKQNHWKRNAKQVKSLNKVAMELKKRNGPLLAVFIWNFKSW